MRYIINCVVVEETISDGDKSAYNSAVQFMFELSGIRHRLHEARWDGDTEMHYRVLKSYFLALSARMDKNLLAKHTRLYRECTASYIQYQSTRARRCRRVRTPLNFDDWELELRRDENLLGLLVPDKKDPAFALGGEHF